MSILIAHVLLNDVSLYPFSSLFSSFLLTLVSACLPDLALRPIEVWGRCWPLFRLLAAIWSLTYLPTLGSGRRRLILLAFPHSCSFHFFGFLRLYLACTCLTPVLHRCYTVKSCIRLNKIGNFSEFWYGLKSCFWKAFLKIRLVLCWILIGVAFARVAPAPASHGWGRPWWGGQKIIVGYLHGFSRDSVRCNLIWFVLAVLN